MSHIAIKHIKVEGLHDQYDVEMSLHPQLNVIYGKNGRGKTTLLHILANILELDFDRFKHIQFRSIDVETYEGKTVRLEATPGRSDTQLAVWVDGSALSPIGTLGSLSDAETAFARESLGARAVYLPAFRAILERSSTDAYYENRERQVEIEAIRKSEMEIARNDPSRARSITAHRATEQHRLTAAKTVQCRQWFGSFVPVIRYPSLVDVRTRLIDEAREATLEMGLFEQSLFSKLFTQVFKAISSSSESGVADNTDQLLDDVQAALSSIDNVYAAPIDVYGEIKSAVAEARSSGSVQNKTAASILRLYSALLLERSTRHKEIFSKIRDFERSVNLFLDGKHLVVNERQLSGGRGVAVYASNERPMNLSALSSGERQVLTMIFCASRLAEDRGIFLVDEPELSLHVDWQRSILGEVVRQAEGRQVIACTHSPEVGAEHFDSVQLFEPKPARRLQEDLFVEFDAPEDV